MAIDYDPGEYIAALGNISSLIDKDLGLGSANIANLNNVGAGGNPFLNFIPQQGPVLGPDEFGSYVIPPSDPTYSSGFDYARSIAGGIPMEQVIAPGVSYSPEQPGGYTQAQLNTLVGTTPVEPPLTQEPDDPSFLGTGIGGLNIPVDRKQIPLRNIFGSPMDADSLITGVPTGREFSVDREPIPPQDFGYGPGILPPLPPIDIDKLIPPKIDEQIFIDDGPVIDEKALIMPPPPISIGGVGGRDIEDRILIDERIVAPPPPIPPQDFGYGPGIMPPLPPMDIPPVEVPPLDIPFIPFVKAPSILDTPLIIDTPTIMDRPTGGRFSIERKRPMELF